MKQFLSVFTGSNRLLIWILEIMLTCIILLFPTHLHYEYHPVQSPYVFDNLPLFSVIFAIWLGLLLLLLFTTKTKVKGNWEGLALVVVFSLVFLGFWGILTPDRQADGIWNLATVGYIVSSGTVAPHANVGYLDFPGIHILAAALSQVTGFSIYISAVVILIVFALLLSSLLYLLFSKTIEDPRLAGFAVLLAIQGNWTQSLSAFFWPRYIGLIFLVIFLVLLNRKADTVIGTMQDRILIIILLAAVTVSYFVTSMTFFFILLGILLVQLVSRSHVKDREITGTYPGVMVDWSSIIFFLMIPLMWELYYAVNFFGTIAQWIPGFVKDMAGGELFSGVLQVAGANFGGSVPMWANVTRWFWLFFIYGLGGILALVSLFRIRKLNLTEKVAIGGLIGIIVVGVIGLFLSPGGTEAQRILMYAPFFLLPIIFCYFLKLKERIRNYALILMFIIFFTLSFPTFLANNSRIVTDAYYPYDYASGEFMESKFGTGQGLAIFGVADTELPLVYAGVRDATYYATWATIKNKIDMWQQIGNLMISWGYSTGQNNMFILSQRGMGVFQRSFGVSVNDPGWSQLEQQLSGSNLIYNSTYVIIYQKK